MPVYATLFVITTMASIGLPFLSGFVGEFLTMVGMFQSQILSVAGGLNLNYIAAMLAGTGVIFAAVYLLWMVQRVFFGMVTNDKNKTLADLSWREIGLMVPLLILMVYMGVFPKPFINRAEPSIKMLHERVMQQGGGIIAEGTGRLRGETE
jgi:NADH-quinone oxidoreductase subunit M